MDVDNLSDEQIRSKLMEFGYPVMPITGTTRKVMKKKLQLLMDSKSKPIKDKRRSLGRYSSEEDSEPEVKSMKNRRATMGVPSMQPPITPSRVTLRKPTKSPIAPKVDVPVIDVPIQRELKSIVTSTSTRTAKILQNARDDFDTGSDSDEIDNFVGSNDYSLNSSYNRSSSLSPGKLPNSFISASSVADAASDRLNQIRARLSLGSPSRGYVSDPDPVGNLLDEKENTPFLSNFTKRLSQLSEPKGYNYKSDIKESDLNGAGGATARNYLNSYRSTKPRAPLYNSYGRYGEDLLSKSFSIPCMVLVVACLFFVFLIFMYMYMGMGANTAVEAPVVPQCAEGQMTHAHTPNCVALKDVEDIKRLLRILLPELNVRAVNRKCWSYDVKSCMSEREIVDFVAANYKIESLDKVEDDLRGLELMSFYNPKWGISLIRGDFKTDSDLTSFEILKEMDSVSNESDLSRTALIILHPVLPWSCIISNFVKSASKFVIFVAVFVGALYAAKESYKYYKLSKQKYDREVVLMVEMIIEIVQAKMNEDEGFIVINHARDMLIPVEERQSKKKFWSDVVKYISTFESRIRTEIQVVQGETVEVWRWLGGGGPAGSSPKNKSWQGQAFETQVGSVNSLRYSPTECLKIRGMLDEGDLNTAAIKKAVLSKCANQCKILHCAVDTASNCVYLKCADPSDAAVAYRNLHGWWFSGNLVTVKYLRLERYMQRFPDAPTSGPPFLQVPV